MNDENQAFCRIFDINKKEWRGHLRKMLHEIFFHSSMCGLTAYGENNSLIITDNNFGKESREKREKREREARRENWR